MRKWLKQPYPDDWITLVLEIVIGALLVIFVAPPMFAFFESFFRDLFRPLFH